MIVAKQILTPKPKIPCDPGMCLVYVREAFGVEAKYASAMDNWQASKRKHTDRSFPVNVWVPVWFSKSDNPDGHVALRQPDGSIWSASDPRAKEPVRHRSLADIERYYGGKLRYLGWTDDVCDVSVVGYESVKPESISETQSELMQSPEHEIIKLKMDIITLEENSSP